MAQTKLESCREQDSSVSDDMVIEEEQEDEDAKAERIRQQAYELLNRC